MLYKVLAIRTRSDERILLLAINRLPSDEGHQQPRCKQRVSDRSAQCQHATRQRRPSVDENCARDEIVGKERAADAKARCRRRRSTRRPTCDADGQQGASAEPRDSQSGSLERSPKQERGEYRRDDNQSQTDGCFEQRTYGQDRSEQDGPGHDDASNGADYHERPSQQGRVAAVAGSLRRCHTSGTRVSLSMSDR